ncbi:MAG: GNAT family N-acetyltransferase [Clostridia bacterium]|jgi:RimJ/RimL family protein N-acetyltransferase|nr:GNAT family N-acetyltransferase [Clostridia bacterium]MBT7122860.1 GNAT family N-acetyltransferase [Clostridia bacterium]
MKYLDSPKQIMLRNAETLVLRRPSKKDARDMLDYLGIVGGESDNLLFGAEGLKLTIEQEIEYIGRMNSDENSLMVLSFVGDTLVSIAQISASDKERIAHNAEVAISVRKSYWRLGIGEAVMRELISYAKHHKNISIVSLGVRAVNHGAKKLYEKMGFEQVGVHKDFFNVDGKFFDEILMDMHIGSQE